MNQPAIAQLGRSKSGLKIGYRLLDMGRNIIQPFTTAGVVENQQLAGMYAVEQGVNAPTDGGYIQWGTKQHVYAEAPVHPSVTPALPPAPAPVDLSPVLQAILAAVATLKNEMANVAPTVQAELAQDRRVVIAELAKQKPSEPVTLESLARRVETAEQKNQKLTHAFSKFIASLEGKGIG